LRIQVNGEVREVDDQSSLSGLVSLLTLKPEQIAVELNKQVVRRGQWENTLLQEGDQVEIVHFVGGGQSADSADYADCSSAVETRLSKWISKSRHVF
jgi:thiamine biosynthesis protein ThiS